MDDRRRILAGPFTGFIAEVWWDDEEGDEVECDVLMFGRKTTVKIPRAHLTSVELTETEIKDIEEEVASTARINAPHAYRRTIWLAERVREGVEDRDLPRLDRELTAINAEMEEADRPFVEDALAKFRAVFQAIPPTEKQAWWNAHRAEWTPRNDAFRAVAIQLFGRALEGSDDHRTMMAPNMALVERIERARHAGYANDLDGTAPIATNPALEGAIEAAPDDDATWLVYGDWLQTQGDPRGELVGLVGRAAVRYADHHERYLLGGLPRHHEIVSYTWRRGWLRTAKVMVLRAHEDAGIEQAPLVRTLLALPSSRFLAELTVGCASVHEEGVPEAIVDALVAGGPRPTLRRLVLDTDQNEEMLSWTDTGPIERVWPLYPNLTSLDICAGNVSLGDFELPALRRLRIETCHLNTDNLASLARATLPALHEIELWFGEIAALAETMALVESPALAHVTQLGLVNTSFTDELAEALARSPVLARIELLDLSRGTLTDAGARTIAAARAEGRAPKLRAIDAAECYLTADGIAALEACELTVTSNQQREIDEPGGERYCAVTE